MVCKGLRRKERTRAEGRPTFKDTFKGLLRACLTLALQPMHLSPPPDCNLLRARTLLLKQKALTLSEHFLVPSTVLRPLYLSSQQPYRVEIEAQRASIILDGKQNGSQMTLKE